MICNVEVLSVLRGVLYSTMDSDSRRYDVLPLTFKLDTTGSGRYLNKILRSYMRIHTREIGTTCQTDRSIGKYGIVLLRCSETKKQVPR